MVNLNKDNPQNQWNNNSPNNPQQPYIQNPNDQYNNPYNNYQGNINPQNPYIPNGNMGYIPYPQPNPKSPKLIYIVLISVIIFFAVIIVLMSTSMRAMFNGGDNQTGRNNQNNIIVTENQQETTTEETTKEETSEEETTTTEQTTTTTTTTTEPIPETVTVTVIVEVEKEVIKEVEVPVYKDYTTVYNDSYYGYVSTQKDPLNIRSGAGESYKVLGSIPKGTYIYVQTTSGNGWYYTTYGGVSGYVSAKYVTLVMSDAYYGYDGHNYYYSYSTATVKTNGSNLYLRDSASMNGNILDRMPNGTTITVIEYGSSWCYVEYNGTRGYASTDYLSF